MFKTDYQRVRAAIDRLTWRARTAFELGVFLLLIVVVYIKHSTLLVYWLSAAAN